MIKETWGYDNKFGIKQLAIFNENGESLED